MFEVGADSGDAPGELQYWVERDHLDQVFPLPAAYHDARMNSDGELAIVTGQGTAHAAATIMALGLDQRFDLSHAYWLIAGIAGGNPEQASLGSAVWAKVWTAEWVYFVAPLMGMFGAAAVYVGRFGIEGVLCAKLHASPSVLCPFACGVEEHVQERKQASSF